MHVLWRGRCVGRFGIRGGRLETRGRAFVGCIFAMAVALLADILLAARWKVQHTDTSSHAWILLTPSPMFLKSSFVSSSKSWTLSLTLSVSRLVPSRAT